MGSKVWFITKDRAGRREILTGDFDTYKDAFEVWNEMIRTECGISICETVYG